MALTPTRSNKISWVENYKEHCIFAKIMRGVVTEWKMFFGEQVRC